ncbi:MAG: hypothetical protein J1F61_04605 [Clostridiales bacterium]|nr:hypothetical protein [Clostridiales bacterium]
MTNFKPSSKLRILAIISCAIIVIGMLIGTILHFVGNGFFNYDGEYSSYKTVTVYYPVIEMKAGDDKIDFEAVCGQAFENAGVSDYLVTKNSQAKEFNRVLEYRFKKSTDSAALKKAAEAITDKIREEVADIYGDDEDVPRSRAVMHDVDTIVGGEHVASMAAVAIATIVVIHLIYAMIRFRFSAAFTAIVADLHNIALYAAILAICRIPVSSTVMVFAVIVTLATAIGVTYMQERIKRNSKEFTNLSVEEITDMSAGQTFKANVALPAFLAIVAILFFAIMAISAMSAVPALTPALLAIFGFIVTCYGTTMFAPAIYCFIKNNAKKIFTKPSFKKGK